MRKSVLSLIVVLSVCTSIQAQETAGEIATKVLDWAFNVHTAIDRVFDRQKAKRLDRQLGYLSADMKKYLRLRKSLTDSLELISEDRASVLLGQLKPRLRDMMKRTSEMESLVPGTIREQTEDLTEELSNVFSARQTGFLSRLELYFEIGGEDTSEILKESEFVYLKMSAARNVIEDIREKLQTR